MRPLRQNHLSGAERRQLTAIARDADLRVAPDLRRGGGANTAARR
jgi:hypothetical protein